MKNKVLTKEIRFNGRMYTVQYDACDAALFDQHLRMYRDSNGTLRLNVAATKKALLPLITGWPKTSFVDGNSLNLCRSNLRQPDYYRWGNTPTLSGEKYIHFKDGHYIIRIYNNGIQEYRGMFKELNDAIVVRDEIIKELGRKL